MARELAVAIIVCLASGCGSQVESRQNNENSEAKAVDGHWPPTFVDIDGQPQRPFDDASVKAVALIFWMQDCPIANSYAPEINRLHEYGPRGVALLVVQVDPRITVAQAAAHQQEYELKPPVVLDPEHRWVKLAGATRTPEAAVVSRDGKLLYRGRIDDRYVAVGKKRPEATKHDLAEVLEAIALGQSIPQATTEAVGCYIPELVKEK